MIVFGILSILGSIWQEIIAAAVILAMAWVYGKLKSRQAWQSKQFKNRIVLALNSLIKEGDKNKLVLRTLFEKDIKEVFKNESMMDLVTAEIEKVTEENPLLQFSKEDSWYILNAILNQISQQFSSGTLKKDMGLDVTTKWYTFCVTFEKDGTLRMRKIRIMIIGKDDLENFPEKEINLESEKHTTRIKTLRFMKEERKKSPHLFMDIELSC